MQQNAPFCVLLKKKSYDGGGGGGGRGKPPQTPTTAFSLSKVGIQVLCVIPLCNMDMHSIFI